MKIAILHNLYGQYARGGAENVVRLMINERQAVGDEIFLMTTAPDRTRVETETNGLKIYYLKSNFFNLAKWPILGRFIWQVANLFSFRHAEKIKKILTDEKPDLVITHNLMGLGFLTPGAIRELSLKHEHILHDIQLLHPSGLLIWGRERSLDGLGAKIYQALTRSLFASPAKVSSPSHWLLELHKARGFFPHSETEIRPLRLRMKDGRTTTIKTAPPAGPVVAKTSLKNLLFVGQIEEHKGVLFLIQTFKKIADPSLRLRVVGDGEKLNEARALANGDNRIEFLGRLTNERTRALMAESDCLVVPSLCYENSPTVIYEAQAVGLPVLAAALGGIPEILSARDRSFRPGEEADLIKNIAEIIV